MGKSAKWHRLLCLMLGHRFHYFAKSGRYGHRYICLRCLLLRGINVPPATEASSAAPAAPPPPDPGPMPGELWTDRPAGPDPGEAG